LKASITDDWFVISRSNLATRNKFTPLAFRPYLEEEAFLAPTAGVSRPTGSVAAWHGGRPMASS
jgi:hypothetical protein